MSYDLAQRLTTSMEGTALTTYSFDPAGNKIKENLDGALTTYTFDPANRLIFQSSASGFSTYTYQGHDGLRRSAWEPGTTNSTMIWDGSDYLGQY